MKSLFSFIFIWLFVVNLEASHFDLTEEEKNWIQSHPIITLGTEAYWSPFVIDNAPSLTGYDVDILNLINKNTGANFQLSIGNWNDMVKKAINKEIDGLSTSSIHEERAKFFNFSNTYYTSKKYLITSNNNSKKINLNDNLIGNKIGYLERNLFDKKLVSQYKKAILVPYKSLDKIIHALTIGEIDATVGNFEIFKLAEKKGLSNLKIMSDIPNNTLNLVFSVRKDYPEAISILNKGLQGIPIDVKKSLRKKWFGTSININNEELSLTYEEKEYLKNKKVLTVANLQTFPPFNFNENNIPRGYSIDYMNLVAKYLNVKIKFISNKSWNQFLTMLKNKQIDIIPHVAINEDRKEFFEFTDFNHIEYSTGVAINKNSDIKSIDDLKDKTIAVTKNSFIESYLKSKFPNQSLYLAASTVEALNFVSLGKASAAIGSLPALSYYIQKEWLSNIRIISLPDLGVESKTALPMAVSKDNLILKSILEKVNLIIPHNEVAKLKKKWMDISDQDNNLSNKEITFLKKKKIIKMCVLPNWLPFEQIDNKGNHIGIGADFMKFISKKINTPIKLVSTKEWSQSLQNIRDRKCDILPVAMDIANRRDSMNFTNPYVKEPFVVATKNDKLFVKDIQALSNKKIGVVKDYAFIDVLKEKNPSILIVSVKNTEEGLERVSSGELFGYIDSLPTVGYAIQRYSYFDLKIAGKLESNIKLSIASRNDEPLLNSIMQKSLDSISQEQKRTLIEKWIEIKIAQEFDYRLLWQVSAVFLVIVLLILYKNRAIVLLNKDLLMAKYEIEEQQNMVNKYVLILTTDTNGIITDVSEAYCKVTGYERAELLGRKNTFMKHPDTDNLLLTELIKTIKNNKIWCGEIQSLKKDASTIWLNMYIEPIINAGNKIGYRAISEDITDKKRIEELSITDKLTGLYNRMKLDQIMQEKIERFKRYKIPFSIIILDIDDFKKVNDTFGHDIGDKVLKTIANIMQKNLRKTDIVGRWGGEEFLIICENTDINQAQIVAENLRKIIEKNNFDKVKNKTASLGISEFSESDNANTIFKRVDDALYKAKNSGKNKTVIL